MRCAVGLAPVGETADPGVLVRLAVAAPRSRPLTAARE
jgi:hypothetical protein